MSVRIGISGWTYTPWRGTWHSGGNPHGEELSANILPPRKNGRDVFVYFDNEVKVRAPHDATTLAYLLGMGPKPTASPQVAGIATAPTGNKKAS